MLCKRMNVWYVYKAHMRPTPSGSLVLQLVKLDDALEMHDRLIFKLLACTVYACVCTYSYIQYTVCIEIFTGTIHQGPKTSIFQLQTNSWSTCTQEFLHNMILMYKVLVYVCAVIVLVCVCMFVHCACVGSQNMAKYIHIRSWCACKVRTFSYLFLSPFLSSCNSFLFHPRLFCLFSFLFCMCTSVLPCLYTHPS